MIDHRNRCSRLTIVDSNFRFKFFTITISLFRVSDDVLSDQRLSISCFRARRWRKLELAISACKYSTISSWQWTVIFGPKQFNAPVCSLKSGYVPSLTFRRYALVPDTLQSLYLQAAGFLYTDDWTWDETMQIYRPLNERDSLENTASRATLRDSIKYTGSSIVPDVLCCFWLITSLRTMDFPPYPDIQGKLHILQKQWSDTYPKRSDRQISRSVPG